MLGSVSVFTLCSPFFLSFLLFPSSYIFFLPLFGSITQQTHHPGQLSPIMTCDLKWISKQSTTYHLYIVANMSIWRGVSNNTGTTLSSHTSSRGGRRETAWTGKGGDERGREGGRRRRREGTFEARWTGGRELHLQIWKIILYVLLRAKETEFMDPCVNDHAVAVLTTSRAAARNTLLYINNLKMLIIVGRRCNQLREHAEVFSGANKWRLKGCTAVLKG